MPRGQVGDRGLAALSQVQQGHVPAGTRGRRHWRPRGVCEVKLLLVIFLAISSRVSFLALPPLLSKRYSLTSAVGTRAC